MNHTEPVETYSSVLGNLPNGTSSLEGAYSTIDKIITQVEQYVGEWLRYQALWNLQAEMVYDNLGSDVSRWMKTLVEIRKSRITFDTQVHTSFSKLTRYRKQERRFSLF